MEQVYTRKSLTNSLKNTEKIIVENMKNVVNENNRNKNSERFRYFTKNWDKLVYTFCVLFAYLFYGLCSGLFSPTMVDMKFLYRTTMADISYGNTFSSVGYLVGSLTGFLYKYINRQLSFIVNIVVQGLFSTTEPLCENLWQFYASMFLNGFGGGVWDSGNSVWVVEMWRSKSPPVLCLSQMMYGIGAIIAPLIVSPFIYGDLSNKTESTASATVVTTLPTILNTTTRSSNLTTNDDINYSVDRRSKLRVPFLISGGMAMIIPIVLLVMFIVKRYKIPEKNSQTTNEKTVSNPITDVNCNQIEHARTHELSPRTRKILIALVALSLNSYSGFEVTFFSYCATYYQYLPIHLSASTAARVMAVMTGTYAAGRGVSAYISSKLKAEIMLTYHMTIISISLAILYFGQNSETIIFAGNALIGFGFSAMWPCYFAFSEKHMKLTDKVTSIFSFASALFSVIAPFIIGPLIESHPEVFLQLEIGLFCTVVLLFIIIMVIVKRSQRYPIVYTISN